jgi:large subunit ribosomal protein L17
MKKLKKGRKFSRKKDQRKALLKSLALAFILDEKIKTTEAKAKELRPFFEKYINRAKNKDLATRRFLSKFFPAKAVKKLVDEIGPRYKPPHQKIGGGGKDRKGGYTRIIKLGPRKTDGARMAIIELVK